MFAIPYRWLPRTIIPNLLSMKDDIITGIGNVIRWVPVIWFDKDYDWAYLAKIMEYKLRRMSANFIKYGHHVGSKKDAKHMLICAELLRRLHEDKYFDCVYITKVTVHKADKIAQYDQEYLFKLLSKHLRSWWN
jgi:hypothetical protein